MAFYPFVFMKCFTGVGEKKPPATLRNITWLIFGKPRPGAGRNLQMVETLNIMIDSGKTRSIGKNTRL
jgi:hypothetical protein